MATCNKCPAVGICPLKEVLGDHKPENPASAANDASIKDKTSNWQAQLFIIILVWWWPPKHCKVSAQSKPLVLSHWSLPAPQIQKYITHHNCCRQKWPALLLGCKVSFYQVSGLWMSIKRETTKFLHGPGPQLLLYFFWQSLWSLFLGSLQSIFPPLWLPAKVGIDKSIKAEINEAIRIFIESP